MCLFTFRSHSRRAAWIIVSALLLAPAAGCTSFSSVTTEKWFEGLTGNSGEPVNDILAYWENQVRFPADSVNQGAKLPGLAGRVYLFNENTGKSVDAHGAIVVEMLDVTNAGPNSPPKRVAMCQFDAESLKQLKRKDLIGDGYTLFVPWEKYREGEAKKLQLRICYLQPKGVRRYTEPQIVSLQGEGAARPNMALRREVPALTEQAIQQQVQQAQRAAPISLARQPQPAERFVPTSLDPQASQLQTLPLQTLPAPNDRFDPQATLPQTMPQPIERFAPAPVAQPSQPQPLPQPTVIQMRGRS